MPTAHAPQCATFGGTAHTTAGLVSTRRLSIVGRSGNLEARLYRSASSRTQDADTLLVFFHGGGFVAGTLDSGDACMCSLAAHLDGVLLAPTYTQAPHQSFPAAAEDAYAAIAQCAAKPRHFDWTGKHLVIGGIEAGGNLAAVAAMMARDRGGPRLAGQLLVMPMLDPGLTSDSMRCASQKGLDQRIASACAEGYRGYLPRAADRVHPYACPLASSRVKGLPPTMIVSIAGDPLQDEAKAYGAKLAASGIEVRTLLLDAPPAASPLVDATARCQSVSSDRSFAAMAAFVSSLTRHDLDPDP
ncbi:MAG: alpha/beta hydrolase fold domain-containing protein [Burkholderiaceae bacterium]